MQLWVKPQPGGALALLALNMQPANRSARVAVDFSADLNLSTPAATRDVWRRVDLGPRASLDVVVPALDSAFFLLTPQRR